MMPSELDATSGRRQLLQFIGESLHNVGGLGFRNFCHVTVSGVGSLLDSAHELDELFETLPLPDFDPKI